MYKSRYNTCLRIQSPEEAMLLDDQASSADLWLGVLDTYDSMVACIKGEMPTSQEVCEEVREKFMKILALRYDELSDRIPGRLKGWTQAMLIFVTVAMAGSLGSSKSLIDPKTREFMKEEKIRTAQSYDVNDWTYTDILAALHCLESKWKNRKMAWRPEIKTYLRYVEHAVDNMITRSSPMYVIDYAPQRGGKDPYNLKTDAMHELMTLIVHMRRSLLVKEVFKVRKVDVPANNFTGWQEREERHLTTRKFRSLVTEQVWAFAIRPSERDRGKYKRRADISCFNAINNYRSLDYIDSIAEISTYKDQAAIMKDPRTADALVICQIHAYFMGTFAIKFRDFYFCPEDKILKHVKSNVTVPFIVERLGRFDCVFQGVVYETKGGSMAEAFIVWANLAKEQGGILYGSHNLLLLLSVLFPPVGAASQSVEESLGGGFVGFGD